MIHLIGNRAFILFIIFLLHLVIVHAQNKDENSLDRIEKKTKANFLIQNRPWTIEIPVWIPGFRGEFAYGDINIEGEDGGDPGDPEDPGDDDGRDILSRLFTKNWYLKFFLMTRVAYEKNRFLAQLDGLAGGVGNSVKFNFNNKEIVQAAITTTNLRLFAGYQLLKAESKNKKFRYELYGYLGVRIHFQNIYSDLNQLVIRLDINPKWAEPIIGIQNQFSLKRWQFIVQGDYGGFFVNTKYSSMIQVLCYYRMGGLTSIKFGWNQLILNHEGRYLDDNLKVRITLAGPMLGLAFHF